MSCQLPKKQILMTPTTLQQSLTYMRNLTVVFISQICYLRKLFPEDNFDIRSVDSLRVRTLKKDKNSELDKILRALSIGIENSAIETISLNILAGDEDLESYTISIKKLRDTVNEDSLRSSVEKVFKYLEKAVEGLDEVPDNGTMTFHVATEKDKWGLSLKNIFTETMKKKVDLQKYKIGKLNTAFHAAEFTVRR